MPSVGSINLIGVIFSVQDWEAELFAQESSQMSALTGVASVPDDIIISRTVSLSLFIGLPS
jgi:hypothetical protein